MIGTTVGKYRILARLGRGGMGTVYRAVDETLDREVAIKVLNSEISDAKLMARFRAEATMLARLNHPEIATIFEIVKTDTDLMMVMELVRGETFDQLSIRSGPQAPERAAYLVAQVLNGLAYAHRAGIVHRDLKPANVMVTESGTIKIMDFGIARVLGAEHLTSDGTMMGTPAYMAPEQVLGKEVDARADLYSAGVVFYRLLTGCLPFQADTPIGMVQKQLWEPPTPVHAYRGDLPEWCETIMTRALAKAPEDRFQSAEEFRSALLSVIGHSTKSMGVHSSAAFPAVSALTPPPVALTPPPVANTPAPVVSTPPPLAGSAITPSGGLTPAELAAAPTVTLVRTPTPRDVEPPGYAGDSTTAEHTGAIDPTIAAPPASAAVRPAAVAAAPNARKAAAASPSSQARRPYVLGAAAVLAIVAVGTGVAWRVSRRSTPVAAANQTATPQTASVAPAVDVAPPEAPATPVMDASANATTSADAPGTVSPSSGNAVVGTDGATIVSPAARPASPPRTAPKAGVPPPTPPADPPAAVVTAVTPPPAKVETPESSVPAGAAALPPVLFSAQTVMVEDGRNRQRDTNVELANGVVTVKGKDNKLVTTVPYEAVVGFTYSNSKQPLWNTPQGPAEVVHLDGGAFGFFKGDQHWVSLRTDHMSLVLRLRDQDTRRVIAAFEERFGKPVERVRDKDR